MLFNTALAGLALLPFSGVGAAQQNAFTTTTITSGRAPIAVTAQTAVPALVPYTGVALDGKGKPLAGEVSATFLIYKDQQGGEPLFSESQIVTFDEAGHYKIQLGAANPNGLPADLFSTGEARWLEVQIAGQPAEPRVLLASVPYALKAADAATLGGLPASAFALAGSNTAVSSIASAAIAPDATSSTVTTTGGTANKIAKFSGSKTIVNSSIYDNGTEVGIGTTSPTATLTVDGTLTVEGDTTFNNQALFAQESAATASGGFGSHPLKFNASVYNSSTKGVVSPRFQMEAEATGNNSSSPSGTLNLLASSGTPALAETGLYIKTNGTIHFASGQTFPATSSSGVAVDGTSTSGTGVEGTLAMFVTDRIQQGVFVVF
jgi:hypothetical protein